MLFSKCLGYGTILFYYYTRQYLLYYNLESLFIYTRSHLFMSGYGNFQNVKIKIKIEVKI